MMVDVLQAPAADLDSSAQAVGFLRADTKLEPLAFGWYAWPHLIAPAQHAMNIVHRHLPLIQSFVTNPAVHLAAARDPKMLGGPFVMLPADRAPALRELAQRTRALASDLIAF